jgi:tetratricopeptide (TPR) repeat protein
VIPQTRYRIITFLGDGGMGSVYEAEHIDLERRVALKILKTELCANARALRLFRTEAKAASRVGSDHIVELYDFAELDDGRLLFTMEMLRGPTLAEEIANQPMAPARVIAILRQVCKGLAAAHAEGVIHRDIKPDNIVLTNSRGRVDSVKILDFGIAAMLGDDDGASPAAGTPHYAAPEIIEGRKTDARSDIYSLGCMGFAMLTGRPPFSATGPDAVAQVLAMQLTTPAPSLTATRPELVDVKGLCAVIGRCLEKAPDDRYANVNDLEADLCGAQIAARLDTSWDDLPLPQAVPAAVRERLLREMPTFRDDMRPKRGRWLWPTVAAGALLLGAGATYLALSRDPPPPPPPPEEPAAPSRVDTLVREARAAAASANYVYPPADDPTAATAFSKIHELEVMEGPEAGMAKREAAVLRVEFAAALVRLGDGYWDREGGKKFASEYYAQALIFERSHPRALERAEVPKETVDGLAQRAEEGAFSTEEIEAAQRRTREAAGVPRPSGNGDGDAPVRRGGSPSKLAQQAEKLMRKGKLSEAEEVLAPAIAASPDDDRVATVQYELLRKQGKHKAAVAVARRLAGKAPSNGKAQMRLGEAEGAVGNWSAAYRAFTRASAAGAEGATKALAEAARKGGAPGGAGTTPPSDPPGGSAPPPETPPPADG